MKLFWIVTLFCSWILCKGCTSESIQKSDDKDLMVNWVDPFIATEGDHGQLFPGATTPFGLVKLSPETPGKGHSGYQYQENFIYGFSHLRTDGPGVTGGGGNILLQPGIGDFQNSKEDYKEEYIKDSEKASPGFYSVKYKSGITTELTVTPRVGFHKYNFPESDSCFILLDLSHSHAGMIDAELEVMPPNKICGYISSYNVAKAKGGNQHFKVYFTIIFNKPFERIVTWDENNHSQHNLSRRGVNSGVWLSFAGLQNNIIKAKVGVSPVSTEEAEEEINYEIPEWDFEPIKEQASKRWEEKLKKINIKTDDDELKKLFYTLLYRSYTSPSITNASSGVYRPALKEDTLKHIDDIRSDFVYYCGWDIWGNYRNKFGLIALTEPTIFRNTAFSLLEYYRNRPNIIGTKYTFRAEGYWPAPTVRQEFAGIYILEGIKKEIVEFSDEELRILYEGMKQDYEEYPDSTIGFILEKSYHAWIVMKMAEIVGNSTDVEKYKRLSLEYKNYWNSNQRDHKGIKRGFFTPKAQNIPEKDILVFNKYGYEGNLWHYRWNLQFDIPGLIKLRGGKEELADDLEYFFDKNLYIQLNQTDIQAPYLFNYLGKPWLTQKWVRKYTTKEVTHIFHNHGLFEKPVVRRCYLPQPKGFLPSMDDDLGQNSSWFVQSAIGLFPAVPGEQFYFIGSPIFPEVVIDLEKGKKLIIKAENVSENNFYIKEAKLNGKTLERPWISHSEISGGAMLEFTMDSVPNYKWGTNSKFVIP